ncbi:MAG: DUF3427 domain-containing protein [Bacillota bacterium]|nr:DUF3427 domain-containing protein [Bacillota bacterium]
MHILKIKSILITKKTDNKILLFVREYKNENSYTQPYYFLGKVNYVSHQGSKPMSIVWRLEEPMTH